MILSDKLAQSIAQCLKCWTMFARRRQAEFVGHRHYHADSFVPLRGGVEARIGRQVAAWPLDERVVGEDEALMVFDFGRIQAKHHGLTAMPKSYAEVESSVMTTKCSPRYRGIGTVGSRHLPELVSVGELTKQMLRFFHAENRSLSTAGYRASQSGYTQQGTRTAQ